MINSTTIKRANENVERIWEGWREENKKTKFRDYYTRGLGQCEDKEGMIRKIQEFRKSELAKEIQDFCMPELEGNPQEECAYYISHKDWCRENRIPKSLPAWGTHPMSVELSKYQKQIRKKYNKEKKVYEKFYMPLYGIGRFRDNPTNLMEPQCFSYILGSQYRRCLKQISIVLSMPKEQWDKYEIRRIVFCLEVAECPCTDNSDPEKRYPRQVSERNENPDSCKST
jgi:hypothetical protein